MKMRGLCVLVGIGLLGTQASAALQPATSSLESDAVQAESASRPGMIAQRCVRSMNRTAHATGDAMERVAHYGIMRIRGLAMDGAPDRAIMDSAHRSIEVIHRRAAAGSAHVNTIADRCIRALHDAGVDRELIERVNTARRHALGSISDSAQRAIHAVRQAADRAIGG